MPKSKKDRLGTHEVAEHFGNIHTLEGHKITQTKAAQVPLGYAEGFRDDLLKVGKRYNGRKTLRDEL